MKSQHMEMDEEWAERGRAGEGREAARANSARHERGGGGGGGGLWEERREEAKDEREGRSEGMRTETRNTRIGEGSVTPRVECQRVMV